MKINKINKSTKDYKKSIRLTTLTKSSGDLDDGTAPQQLSSLLQKALALTQNVMPEHQYLMEVIHPNRDMFAKYLTINYAGSLEKRGSSHSEQNHSSIIHHTGRYFSDDLIHQLQRMLTRQRDIIIQKSQMDAKYRMEIPSKVTALHDVLPLDKSAISDAAFQLSPWGLDLFLEELKMFRQYSHEIQEGNHVVKYLSTDNCNPRVFYDRCNCPRQVNFLIQCRHELAASCGKFCVDIAAVRHARGRRRGGGRAP